MSDEKLWSVGVARNAAGGDQLQGASPMHPSIIVTEMNPGRFGSAPGSSSWSGLPLWVEQRRRPRGARIDNDSQEALISCLPCLVSARWMMRGVSGARRRIAAAASAGATRKRAARAIIYNHHRQSKVLHPKGRPHLPPCSCNSRDLTGRSYSTRILYLCLIQQSVGCSSSYLRSKLPARLFIHPTPLRTHDQQLQQPQEDRQGCRRAAATGAHLWKDPHFCSHAAYDNDNEATFTTVTPGSTRTVRIP